nr:glycosyltransferase [uncultured Bacteroides sp.]
MNSINLFLMDMNTSGNTTGVDRYIGVLLEGLKSYPFVQVVHVNFRFDPNLLLSTDRQKDGYREVVVPLPQHPDKIITEGFWMQRYCGLVYDMTRYLFEGKKNCILHLHTLNLIDMALLIKEHRPECRIVTHLHCIPWKGLYNRNMAMFNRLYEQVYILHDTSCIKDWRQFPGEIKSYTHSDCVICVTRCACQFLNNLQGVAVCPTFVIPNGIYDANTPKAIRHQGKGCFQLLYVGVLSPSKGLSFILKALQILREQHYEVSLTIVGKGERGLEKELKKTYKELSLHFTGIISFKELKDYYCTCDAGVIASLQEQCSYVAIEMAMFGLPIVTTAVDGLDEMFNDEVNALKVPLGYSKEDGLSVDIDTMAKQISRLIDDKQLRKKLARNVRRLYEEKFRLADMMERTIAVYKDLTKEF